jgi:microcompartment protein CcmK/EutM
MLIVQPLTPELRETGKRLVCLDCTGAGTGELVYWVRGKEASFPFLPAEPPADTTIVGIVDSVHVKREEKGDGDWGRGLGEGSSLRSQHINKKTRAKRASSPQPPPPTPS